MRANGETTQTERPLFHILPRGMNFSRAKASSIDLFVSEVAAHSRFPIEIVAEFSAPALPAKVIHALPTYRLAETHLRARFVAELAQAEKPRLLIVQQHLPTAAAICARVEAPVLLQRHNFLRPPRPGLWGSVFRARHTRQLDALAGLTFVSEIARNDFERDWPEVKTPRWVVTNGVDCADWRGAEPREPLVLVVGRATPEKGLLEAAEALAAVLPENPAWAAAFVIAGAKCGGAYFDQVQAALAPLQTRAKIFTDIPFAEVKAFNERAAIAVIPSKWREPFGRTCLEAFAGGAAVITSGSGGLSEIAGDAALLTPEVTTPKITEALRVLIGDEGLRRRLGGEGRARAEAMFNLPRVAAKLDDVCETILARSTSAK